MTDLPTLLADIEAAKEPSREIEITIWRQVEGGLPDKMPLAWIAHYTRSMDDALALFDRLLSGADYQINGDGNWCRAKIVAPPKPIRGKTDRPEEEMSRRTT